MTVHPPDDEREKAAIRRDFRRGNINFDFLLPADERAVPEDYTGEDRRGGKREGKRGLFNRGRPQRPVGTMQIVGWGFLMLFSVAGFVAIVLFGESIILLLFLPLFLLLFLWSLVMIVLFKARPG